ncbi:MAG: helix-turn-helix domain-containing protein [Alphaproteobacteria bacterium]|nr:helix-turn-helix domain-containing protein [Alphaproteobacteria bacterium]
MKMYHYTESGLDNIWLVNGYTVHDTPYGKGVSIDNADSLHKAIGHAIASGLSKIKPQEFRFLRIQMELSQKDLGAILGVDQQAIARWEKGKTKEGIPGSAEKLMRLYFLDYINEKPEIIELCKNLAELDEQNHAKKRKFEDYDGNWRQAA